MTGRRPAKSERPDAGNPGQKANARECDPEEAAAAAASGSEETRGIGETPAEASTENAPEPAGGTDAEGKKTGGENRSEEKISAETSGRIAAGAEVISSGGAAEDAATANAIHKAAEPIKIQAAGAGSDVQKTAAAATEAAEKAAKTSSPVTGGLSGVESTEDGKKQSPSDEKIHGFAGKASADTKKSSDEAGRADRRADQSDPSIADSKAGTGRRLQTATAAADRNAPDAGGREPVLSPRKIPPGQGAFAQNPQMPGISQPSEASAARAVDLSADQQGAGRMQGELQRSPESEGKTGQGGGEENFPRLTRANPGARDGAFMQHQNQNFERLLEPAVPPRDKESLPGAMRASAMDQIVDRAVYQLKNGQNSVRIDLKPEFLGQVRMQIVTVDHQVSVRITAELPLVREMLETHLQQLKADLQQQGLAIDKIEISMSADSQRNAQNRKGRPGSPSRLKTAEAGDNGPATEASQAPTALRASARSAVDMFV